MRHDQESLAVRPTYLPGTGIATRPKAIVADLMAAIEFPPEPRTVPRCSHAALPSSRTAPHPARGAETQPRREPLFRGTKPVTKPQATGSSRQPRAGEVATQGA